MSMLSAEERAALQAGVAPKEARAQTTSGSGGAAGGYTVPTELSNQIIISMAMWTCMQWSKKLC